MDNPLLLILLIPGGFYLAKIWFDDLRAAKAGVPHKNALPGATPTSWGAVSIAVAGALAILAVETFGEHRLGLTAEQSKITWLFAVYSMLAAPVVEEMIFRGMLIVEKRGAALMWGAALAASLLFTLAHPFMWRWEEAGFELTLTAKGWFSAAVVFALSLWLYAARLGPWNPTRSLLPCIVAHAAKNIGVVGIKAATGFVQGTW